jgi:hypothetical protein
MAILSILMEKNDCLALARQSGAPLAALSPLGKLPPTQAPLSQAGQPLANNPDAKKHVGTLANPDWLVTMRMGGGDWPITELCLCAKRTASDITGIRPTADGLVEVLGWSSVGAFVDWWCDAHANNLEETAQNFLPPSCTLEAFVMNLQAIDAYRRALLGSLLAHEPSDPLLMTAEQFNQHCLSGIRSHDVRWLAPAFISLVPGLGEYKLGGTPESARAPFDRALLRTAFHPDTGAQCIGFGEPGQAMGLEFARTWMLAAGLEARLPAPEGSRAIARCFVAPTGVTNHLVKLETGSDGRPAANHQTVTGSQLKQALTAFFDTAVKASATPLQAMPAGGQPAASQPAPQAPATTQQATPPPPPATPQQAAPPPAAAPAVKFCGQCGTKMDQAAAFCPNCGAPQQG